MDSILKICFKRKMYRLKFRDIHISYSDGNVIDLTFTGFEDVNNVKEIVQRGTPKRILVEFMSWRNGMDLDIVEMFEYHVDDIGLHMIFRIR